jgi:hypothetical protein
MAFQRLRVHGGQLTQDKCIRNASQQQRPNRWVGSLSPSTNKFQLLAHGLAKNPHLP